MPIIIAKLAGNGTSKVYFAHLRTHFLIEMPTTFRFKRKQLNVGFDNVPVLGNDMMNIYNEGEKYLKLINIGRYLHLCNDALQLFIKL